MSVNTAHTNGGVLIHYGEYILIHSENVSLDFVGQDNPIFKGTKNGHIYLTSHRMIFNSKKQNEELMSFSAPFIAMSDVDIEQPVFGANYIKGKVRAQPNGNFIGEVKFKLYFKSGGAIEYGQAMLRAASIAQQNMRNSNGNFDDPPPYTPSGAWHEAPPPAYQPPPGYYGWIPQNDAFTGPAPNSVFVSDNPPPYPGIGTHSKEAEALRSAFNTTENQRNNQQHQQQQQQQHPNDMPPPSYGDLPPTYNSLNDRRNY
ncbi:WW domain-binding protein 2 isoform X3 [Episyrphus balteatus]|uniref:WW domain-binding protein 2 isoform X3 n=1 Tax=Episyrphus balteatus TaxID=286459 RepID=UPI0024858C81|nr:WW domain-binding protein 2 isoform X3 [Episyrphus balteatus]